MGILNLHAVIETQTKLYFVFDYCPAGKLFFHLRHAGRFSEEWVKFYSAEILLAIAHLHKLNIAHRNFYPENILLDEDGHVKLGDPILSKVCLEDDASENTM